MPRLTPQQIADKQVARVQGASQDYVNGVNAVSVSPMQQAKKKKDKLKANFLAAIDSGKWEAGLDSVTLEQWKSAAAETGSARLGQGVEAARGKIVAFHEEFDPFLERVRQEVNAMPDTTLEQRLAKAAAMGRKLAEFKRTRRRR